MTRRKEVLVVISVAVKAQIHITIGQPEEWAYQDGLIPSEIIVRAAHICIKFERL